MKTELSLTVIYINKRIQAMETCKTVIHPYDNFTDCRLKFIMFYK